MQRKANGNRCRQTTSGVPEGWGIALQSTLTSQTHQGSGLMYLDTRSDAVFKNLKLLQEKYKVSTTPEETAAMINEDRYRDIGP
jgi:hypothetical protein